MGKTDIVQARIEPQLKQKAEKLFEELGLNATTAIRLFYTHAVEHNGIPFAVKKPSRSLKAAIKEMSNSKRRDKMETFSDVAALHRAILAED
jgi:DNA-damage-inducible protein J